MGNCLQVREILVSELLAIRAKLINLSFEIHQDENNKIGAWLVRAISAECLNSFGLLKKIYLLENECLFQISKVGF